MSSANAKESLCGLSFLLSKYSIYLFTAKKHFDTLYKITYAIQF